MSSTYKHVVFSDIDGTLVHYPAHLQKGSGNKKDSNDNDNDELVYLPPSKTGTRGVLSTRTLKLCHQLRHGNTNTPSSKKDHDEKGTAISNKQQKINSGGVPFVLVSGMRTTTLFQRLPYLPRADAYVSESGGRIFYPRQISKEGVEEDNAIDGVVKGLVVHPVSYPGISPSDATPFSLVEDMHWRTRISQLHAAGSDGYDDAIPIEQRRGTLWEFARTLSKQGYVLDNSGYATAYRINRKHQSTNLALKFDEFIEKCSNKEGIPDELGCSTNLGCVDVYPTMSGKKKCADYLVTRFLQSGEDGDAQQPISLKTHASCLCDDDNDIEMALACRAAYLPSVTSESIRSLVNNTQSGGTLVVTEDATNGIIESLATEAALEAIMNELQ